MKTKTIKIKILILVLVLLYVTIVYASAESLQITDVRGNPLDYAIKGETLTILVSSDDLPVADADVYFKLNAEAPVHTRTNEAGMAVFKPLSTGILKTTARKDGKTKEIEIRVIQKESILQIQVPSYAIKGETIVVKVIADDQPIADVDTYFKLNEGAPIHVKTNETGTAAFKPLVTDSLKITAQKDAFEPASTSILISEKAPQVSTCIPNATATPGSNVTLPIMVENVNNLAAGTIWLTYDPSVVHVLSVSPGDLGGVTTGIDNTTGKTTMSVFTTTPGSGSMTFANVLLRAVGAINATSPLTLSVLSLADQNGNPISHIIKSGTFTISSVIKGDANGDGAVTIVDALFIAQYTVGLRTLTAQQLAAADVNNDGQVNIVDALFIAQYTVGLRQL